MIKDTNITSFSPIEELDNIKFNITSDITTKYDVKVVQNINTFDIECCNVFVDPKTHIAEGFNYDKAIADPEYYKRLHPISCEYIWQTAIETYDHDIKAFHGRTWESYDKFLDRLTENILLQAKGNKAIISKLGREKAIESAMKQKGSIRLIIFIHNLGYEYQHLRNLYNEDFAFTTRAGRQATFARKSRKPMKTYITKNKVKIEFRDSYSLTQKGLGQWCKDENLPVKKLEEPKDYYLKVRTPLTKLAQEDLQYSINDVVSMVYGIDKYRTKYGCIENIPLTQTGCVRRVCVERIAEINPAWSSLCAEITQNYSLEFYNHLQDAFSGGWTHGNCLYTGKTLRWVSHFDFASDYPNCMTCFTYPLFEFKECSLDEYDYLSSQDLLSPDLEYHYMIKVKVKEVHSRTRNTYWSSSKCEKGSVLGWFTKDENGEDVYVEPKIDNGKIYACKEAIITMTDIDWDTFQKAYKCEDFEVLKLWKSKSGYLPFEVIDTILDYYGYKTTLKYGDNNETTEEMIIRLSKLTESKQFINSIYGVAVTKIATALISFIESSDRGWEKIPLNEDLFRQQIGNQKEETTFLSFQLGVWVTSWARSFCLWQSLILKLDKWVVYGDTDSLFLREGFDKSVIDKYNEDNDKRQEQVVAYYQKYGKNLKIEHYRPKNKKGQIKSIGQFEEEPQAWYFRELGAKRYVVERREVTKHSKKSPYTKKVVECTIAGLPKKAGSNKIKKADDFNSDLVWNCKESMKQTAYYNDNQIDAFITDEDGNTYHCVDKYGCCIVPTSFDLSISEQYAMFLNFINNNFQVPDIEGYNETDQIFWGWAEND